MDLKEKKMRVKIILCGLALIIVVISLFIAFMHKDEEKPNSPVSHKAVEKLYEDNGDDNCTEVVKITQNLDVSDIDDKILLNLIFGQMKKDEILGSNISMDDYRKSALKILDEENIPLEFEYIYEGYKYSANDDGITRSKASCEENYVSKLYGYSGTNDLELDIMAGYVKDGKVYDLNDKEIGTYSEDDLNKVLDSGTMQVYNYKKVNGDYKLVSVGVK